MLHSEKQVMRVLTSTFYWSIELAQAVQTVQYWNLCLKCMKGNSVTDRSLETTGIGQACHLKQQTKLTLSH